MRYSLILILLISLRVHAQDTTVMVENQPFTLAEVVVRNNFDYKRLLTQIKEDTTFYKAFRNLRVLGFSSYNDIKMLDKNGAVKASLNSKTIQHHENGCRTMDVLEETVTGDFYDSKNSIITSLRNYMRVCFLQRDKSAERIIL